MNLIKPRIQYAVTAMSANGTRQGEFQFIDEHEYDVDKYQWYHIDNDDFRKHLNETESIIHLKHKFLKRLERCGVSIDIEDIVVNFADGRMLGHPTHLDAFIIADVRPNGLVTIEDYRLETNKTKRDMLDYKRWLEIAEQYKNR